MLSRSGSASRAVSYTHLYDDLPCLFHDDVEVAFAGLADLRSATACRGGLHASSLAPVSYTHLDVYKRQVWFCALARRRDVWLRASIAVLTGEGVALVVAKGCPFGVFQRRAGDDVPMFELWFGPRVAPFAIPAFTAIALVGAGLLGLWPAATPAPRSNGLVRVPL